MRERWRTIPGFVCVGRTGKTRGRDGEIKLFPDEPYLDDVLNAEFLFIEIDGDKVPLRIAALREAGDLLVLFEGIENPGSASPLSSARVFLPSDEVRDAEVVKRPSGLQYEMLQGYTVHDAHLGEVGTITEVREFPQQEMAVIRYRDREVLVPLNTEFIIDIDHAGTTVHVELPEGLLEV